MALWLYDNPNTNSMYSPMRRKLKKDIADYFKTKKIDSRYLSLNNYAHIQEDPDAVLCILQSSPTEIDDIIKSLSSLASLADLPVITMEYDKPIFSFNHYNLITDSNNALLKILTYTSQYKKNRIAFFGVNPASTADTNKVHTLSLLCPNFNEKDLYCSYNENMDLCFSEFSCHYTEYDTVVCANDYVAIYFLKQMTALDPGWLEDRFVIGFMNSIISRLYSHPITTLFYDSSLLPQLIYLIYKNHFKYDNMLSYNAMYLKAEIFIRSSTHNLPFDKKDGRLALPFANANAKLCIPTYSGLSSERPADSADSEMATIIKIDTGLSQLNIKNLKLVLMILRDYSISEISEALFFSIDSVKYHLRSIYRIFGVKKKKELISILSLYINPDRLEQYIDSLL